MMGLFLGRKLLFILLACCVLMSCEPSVRERPYGDLRLGKITEFLAPETYLKAQRLLLRRDERGWYVMSTMCSHDLSALELKEVDGKRVFYSQFTSSSYDLDGNVLSGPAVEALPYYELYIDQGTYDGMRDTLYARVGEKRSKDWRLPLPMVSSPEQTQP
ncbi:MAG: Rieske 2Fe-2S domain-containing protein [Oligoflexia bacterium]|nr:Rieske 2Fe-2S domain-containing protein [Oligoflexia bacterium]